MARGVPSTRGVISGLLRAALLASTALALASMLPATGPARAQDATWQSGLGDYFDPNSWTPYGVPTGTATFGDSSTTTVLIGSAGSIGGWTLNAGASDYTFNLTGVQNFTGAGITINGGSVAINNDSGLLEFLNTSTAGSATITNNGNLNFNDASTAGDAAITNNNTLNFRNTSTADSATITNNGELYFYETSAAGNAAIITNNNGGNLYFNSASTAGGANITNDSFLQFSNTSTAGSATITNSRLLYFNDASTAGNAAITNNGDVLQFYNTSTADSATITNNGNLNFNDASTAGSTIITNNFRSNFYNASTAGGATVTNNAFRDLYFHDTSTAGDATITNNGTLIFLGTSTAGSATLINNSANGLYFFNNSTAGSAALVNNAGGAVDFSNSTGPNGDSKISAGSIAGAGNYRLGANELTVGSNNGSTEVSGVISGNGGALVKTGTGTMTLSGTNTYSGGTTISGGGLQLGNGGSTGSIVGNVVNDGVLTFNRSDVATFSGDISGSGAVRQVGLGTAILTGGNSYSGGTSISGGTLQLGNSGATGSILGNVTNNGVLAFNRSDAMTFAGDISGGGAVQQIGSGTTILSGTNSYSGGTTINSGTLQLGNANTVGTIAGAVTVGSSSTFDVVNADTSGITSISNGGFMNFRNDTSAGSATIANNYVLSFYDSSMAGSASITNDGDLYFYNTSTAGSATIANNSNLYFNNNSTAGNAAIAGNGSLRFYDTSTAGDASITNNNGLTFYNTSTAGNADITNDGNLYFYTTSTAGNAAITNNAAGTVDFSGTAGPNGDRKLSAGSIAGAGNYILGANELTIGSDNLSTEVSGVISGAGGSLVKAGTGTLSLSGTNTYSGGTTISSGGLQLGNGGTTGSIVGNVVNDGVLTFNRSDVATFSGDISGSGAVRQVGLGTAILTGTNNYTGGTVISGGELQLGNGGATGSIVGNVANDGVLTFNRNDVATFSGDISGNGAVRQTGTGTTILTGNNIYSGGTTISGGTLQIGDGGATGSITGNVTNNGALAFNRTGTQTFAGDISGIGAVQQIGPGTTILTGTNTYSGDTLVSGGRLQFGDGSTGGSNTLGGNLTVSGGTLAIQTPATLNVAQTVTFADNTALSIVAGANSPALSADSVTIGNGVALNINGIDDASQLDKVLINTTSGISGDFAGVSVGGFGGTVDYLTVSTRKSTNSLQYLASYGLTWNAGNNLAQGTFTLTNATDSFTVGTVLADQVANPATGSSGISLTKAGAGTLVLTGENTYSGGTTIAGGTLRLGNGGATGSILGNVVNDGVFAFNRSDVATFAGDISGGGAVQQIGSGTTILTGSNTYAGRTTISGGTLQLGNGGATGSITGNVANDGVLTFNRNDAATFSGDISGNGAVRQTGTGTTILSGTNSYSGGTTINAGTLQLGNANTAGTIGGAVTVGSSGTFDVLNADISGINSISNGGITNFRNDTDAGSATITNNNGLYFYDNSTASGAAITNTNNAFLIFYQNSTVGSAAITNNGGMRFYDTSTAGSGAITNNGNLHFYGSSTAGSAAIFNNSSLYFYTTSTAGSAAIVNNATGSVYFSPTTGPNGDRKLSAGSIAGAGNYQLGNNELTVGSNDRSTEVSGVISGNGGSLVKTGTGTMTLSGTNTYSGGTTISGGGLQLGNGGTTGLIVGNVANDGVLTFNRNDAATFAGDISGNGAVRQTGTGRTILTGTNIYSGGTTISGGTFQIGDGGATGSITGNVTNNGALAFNRTGTRTFAGDISGDGAVQQIGSGTTILTGANTYSGGTTISGGTLQLGNGGATGSILGDVTVHGAFDIVNADTSGITTISNNGFTNFRNAMSAGNAVLINNAGGTVDFSNSTGLNADGKLSAGSIAGAGSYVLGANELTVGSNNLSTEVSGGISGAGGSLVKTGTGTLILTGANTYTGGTTISGGTLQFGNGMSGGGNNLGGSINVTGGTLAIQSPATLNVGQTVTFGDNTALSIAAGANSPALSANSVTIGNGVAFNISGIDDASQLDKVLINTTSGISGDFAGVSVGGFGGTVDYLTVSTRKSTNSLQYLASYGLTWNAGNNLAQGTFTLTNATDSFTVGTVLADQVANPATGSSGISLTKAGAGTLTLTGENTYSGGTTISGGTLSVSRDANLGAATGGLTISGGTLSITLSFDTTRVVSLTQAGRFDVAAGTELGLTGVASGSGDLIKQGSGTLRLDNSANAYSDTLVAAGTLIGNADSISGTISNAGTLAFDQADNAGFSGDIAALNGTSGAMIKRGAGVLTLTGLSSLDWAVETGGLVSSAERFGGNAAIASGASFTFDQSANATYAGVLSGNGGVNKTGSALLNLTGDSSGFTGTTTVAGGTLAVNGALGGMLDVLTAGRLQGTGTVGDTTVSGTIAPGNSIGTINVAGNITFNTGSIYEVEVNAAGQSDRIVATGTATINGGTVTVLAGAGNYAPQTQYTILAASSGRTGTFTGGVTSNLAFLDPSLSYDANNVYLTMTRNEIDFAGVGLTANQIATGDGVESLGGGNLLYDAVVNLSAPQAQYAFEQLSGEIHASAGTALIEDSRFIRNAVNDRIRAAFDAVGASGTVSTYDGGKPVTVKANTDRFAVWGQGFGSWGHANGDGNAARLNRSTGGFITGADAPVFDTWRFGAVAGYSQTSFDVKDRHSSGSSDNYHVGLYGGTAWGDLAFRTGAAYTWHDVSTNRSVTFPGFGGSLKGDYNAATAQMFGELAYGVSAGGARFEPFANFAYVNLRTDGFTEQGGAAALTGASSSTDAAFTTLGLRAATTFDLGGTSVTAKGMIGWRHAFGDVTPVSTMRFAGGGNAFNIGGVPITRDAAVIEGGLDYAVTPNATLGVSYGGQFGSGMSDQSGRLNFNVKF